MSEDTIADHRAAFIAIEAELGILESAAGVLHMLYVNIEPRQGSDALAHSVWFTACGIEGAVARIRSMLEHGADGEVSSLARVATRLPLGVVHGVRYRGSGCADLPMLEHGADWPGALAQKDCPIDSPARGTREERS